MKMFQLLMAAGAMMTAGMLAAEEIPFAKLSDWEANKNVKEENGVFVCSAKTDFFSKKFPVDPTKSYKVQITFSAGFSPKKSPVTIFAGFTATAKDKKIIQPYTVTANPESITELIKPIKTGDKVFYVKDGSKFKIGTAYTLTNNAKKDLSDLPNRHHVANGLMSATKEGDCWKMTTYSICYRPVPKGSMVRQQMHIFPPHVVPAIGNATAKEQWKTVEGTLKGIGKYGWSAKEWPAGTVQGQIAILINEKKAPVETRIKDVKLIVE